MDTILQQTMSAVFVYMGQGSVVPRDVTRVRVHPSVRIIAARAFEGCHELVEVELFKGLEEIGEPAFCGCKSLKQIAIPSTVRVICSQAFHGCMGWWRWNCAKGLMKLETWHSMFAYH